MIESRTFIRKNQPQNEIAKKKNDEKSFNKCSIMGAQKEKVLKNAISQMPCEWKINFHTVWQEY